MRSVINLLIVCLFVYCAQVLAADKADTASTAKDLVMKTTGAIQAKLKEEKSTIAANPKRLYELVNTIVLPHFDFNKMSQWVLGKHWSKAKKDQKKRFTEEFRKLLVRTYAKALIDNIDSKIEYLPFKEKKDATDVKVRTEIPQPGGFPLPINYSLQLTDGIWKVYDIDIDGISLIKNYRSTFGSEIKKTSIEKLVNKLVVRNEQAVNE